jgi:hypothetical protein
VLHLNAYLGGSVRLSADARTAVVLEATPANTMRLAVWNVDSGKLVRFLSSEANKPSLPYQGKENADFGAKVDFKGLDSPMLSPSGRTFAARSKESQGMATYAWDVESGKLLSRFVETADVNGLFHLPHDDYVVMNVTVGEREVRDANSGRNVGVPEDVLERVHLRRSESDLLAPIGLSGQQAVSLGGQMYFLGQTELHKVNVETREHWRGESLAPSVMTHSLQGVVVQRSVPQRYSNYADFWLSTDATQVYGCTTNGQIDIWDAATLASQPSFKLSPRQPASNPVIAMPQAGLVAMQMQSGAQPQVTMQLQSGTQTQIASQPAYNDVDVFDLATKQLVTAIRLPFKNGRLQAISSDGKRWLISTDQTSLLVVDFPDSLPAGLIDLGALLTKTNPSATR